MLMADHLHPVHSGWADDMVCPVQALKTGFRIAVQAMQSNNVIEPGYNVTITEIQQ
jgi:hypothetical protein